MKADSFRSSVLISCGLILLVTAVFHQVLSADFVNFDDPIYVAENMHVQDGLGVETIKWAFTTHLHGHYHPVTWLSHALDTTLFGLDPFGHHFSSFLLHLINTVLLFLILRKLTGAELPSAFAAAVFGIHPLHVEPVAWVAGRKDLLCAFFWMVSLWIYTNKTEKGSLRLSLLLMLTYFLGLLSKSMMITLPLVLVLLDFWPLQRFSSQKKGGESFSPFLKIVLEKSGLLLIAILFVLVSTNAMQDLKVESKTLAPFWQYDFLLFFVHYLEKFFWPTGLTVLYPYNEHPEIVALVLAALFLTVVTVTVIWLRRRWPFLLVGWLWFVVTMLPVAGLIHGGPHRVADRYSYIPLIGLIIALTWLGGRAAGHWKGGKRVIAVAGSLVLMVLSFLSYVQSGRWQSSTELFTHAVSIYPDNWIARNNLGDALDRQGEKRKAIDQYLLALKVRPEYAKGHYNLGNTLASMGRDGEALRHYLLALQIYPEFAEAHSNAGVLLAGRGRYLEAKRYFQRALELNPEYDDAQKNLKDLFGLIHELEERIAVLHGQLESNPNDAELCNSLGLLYREGGDVGRALEFFQKALQINPSFAGAHNNMGIIYAERRNYNQAAHHFQQAVELDPDFAGAGVNLERINRLLQRPQEKE